MDYEVERKFRLMDARDFISAVKSLGGSFSLAEHHSDTYFAHPCRNFKQTDEAFRIRSIGPASFVTYKGPKIDKETKTRRELELPVPGNAEVFREMVECLGFQPVATVTKTRRTAKVVLNNRDFEICLDQVDHVGSFTELETIADDSDLDQAKADMAALARQLPIDEDERRSYLSLLLEALGEE